MPSAILGISPREKIILRRGLRHCNRNEKYFQIDGKSKFCPKKVLSPLCLKMELLYLLRPISTSWGVRGFPIRRKTVKFEKKTKNIMHIVGKTRQQLSDKI